MLNNFLFALIMCSLALALQLNIFNGKISYVLERSAQEHFTEPSKSFKMKISIYLSSFKNH